MAVTQIGSSPAVKPVIMTMPDVMAFLAEQGIEVEKRKKTRLVKLTDDPKGNVTKFACGRLASALNSVRIFGNCYGGKYDWSKEQIDKAEAMLKAAVDGAIGDLRHGKRAASLGITL